MFHETLTCVLLDKKYNDIGHKTENTALKQRKKTNK